MSRYFYFVLSGLVGAAIVHLTVVFLLPTLSDNKSYLLIEESVDLLEPTEIFDTNAEGEQNFLFDPLFRHFVCRYDLSQGAIGISAQNYAQFWSLSVFDETGTAFFSTNDRITSSDLIDVAIVNDEQLRFARQNTPEEIASSLVAPAATNQGFALIRVLSPNRSWESDIDLMLQSIECGILDF